MAYFSNYKIKPQLNETQFLSEIELAILRSEAPIEIDETETVTVNQQTGKSRLIQNNNPNLLTFTLTNIQVFLSIKMKSTHGKATLNYQITQSMKILAHI